MEMNTNKVELIGHYGGDETHALSAWTSTSRELTPEKRARIPNLLKMLRDGSDGQPHGTPFEKSMIHFLVTTDIATHIHILKHRIAVPVNAESARYKELKDDKAYVPNDWPDDLQETLRKHNELSQQLYHSTLTKLIDAGISKKRAKESARYFLPYSTQITADVAFNFRSFIHFCGLRAKDGAQLEVRELARDMIRLVSEIEGDPFHHSLRVWGLVK